MVICKHGLFEPGGHFMICQGRFFLGLNRCLQILQISYKYKLMKKVIIFIQLLSNSLNIANQFKSFQDYSKSKAEQYLIMDPFLEGKVYSSTPSMDNLNGKGINSPPGIMGKLSKKKSSAINYVTKSQYPIASQNSRSSLPGNKSTNKYPSNTHKKPFQLNKQPQQFQFVNKIFSNLFTSQYLSFNELIYALKSIGIEIDSQRKFIQIKNIFDELKMHDQSFLEYENCIKIGIKLLREEKAKLNSDITHLQKAYYHMVQQSNKIHIPSNVEINSLAEFKSYIFASYPEKRYLAVQSFQDLVKYLGIENQYSQQTINEIMKHNDQQGKGYLTFEDILYAIQNSQLLY